MVKFQVAMIGGGRPDHMLMYDRQRSFNIYWKRNGDPEAFGVAERAAAVEAGAPADLAKAVDLAVLEGPDPAAAPLVRGTPAGGVDGRA